MKALNLIGGLQTIRNGQTPRINIINLDKELKKVAHRHTYTEFWDTDVERFVEGIFEAANGDIDCYEFLFEYDGRLSIESEDQLTADEFKDHMIIDLEGNLESVSL